MAGSRLAPSRLADMGLFERWPPDRRTPGMTVIEAQGMPQGRDTGALADLCERIERAVVRTMRDPHTLPVVISGDHSSAIGTWRGVVRALRSRESAGARGGGGARRAASLGLLWIDAHMDAHTPQSSRSGALHGMPLAALLGEGDARLLAQPATLDPLQVAVVGVRSFEPEEADRLARLGVRVYTRAQIRERTLAVVLAEAVQHVRRSTTGWGITLDVDAIDPDAAPGVNTPVADGLGRGELLDALASIAPEAMPSLRAPIGDVPACLSPARSSLVALEITEYNPRRDPDGRTARLVEALLRCLLIAPGGTND